ncbi:MAG: molybdopterin molybdotransferase MoeA [Planctomycetota bacterium]
MGAALPACSRVRKASCTWRRAGLDRGDLLRGSPNARTAAQGSSKLCCSAGARARRWRAMANALSLLSARARVLACARGPVRIETVPLHAAHGRFLAEAVHADGPWPATDRSAMDGFAVAAGTAGLAAGTALRVVGESLAGRPFVGTLPAGAAIRIMTGAVVPPDADAVVPVEQTSGYASEPVVLQDAVRAGQNVRPMGSELSTAQEVLAAGRRLDPAAIGVLAVLGKTMVCVACRPVVAIVATGDEVVPVEQTPLPHQVRESNSWAVAAQVEACGAVPRRLGIAPDEPVALRAMLSRGLDEADVLVTIGGISKGTHDLVHGTLEELGVQREFHGIDLKPGKPTFFGTRSAAAGARFVFGLPGNPASSFTVFDLLVRPLLFALSGADPGELRIHAPAAGTLWRPNARFQAVPARLQPSAAGTLEAALAPPSPSGDPFGLLWGNVYALVPAQVQPGDVATIQLAGGAAGVALP